MREFPPLLSVTRPLSARPLPSASAAICTEVFDSIVDDVCDSYLDGCSVFSRITDDSDSDADFSSGGSVETPVRPAGMETRSVEDTPSHDAGRGIDVNNVNNVLVTGPVSGSVNCSSSATSAVVGPAASFDVGVNSNIDSSDLSPVNNNMTIIGSVTAANGGANACSDLNVNAFSATTSHGAHLNVEVNPSCSKVTAAASGASVYII